MSAPRVLVVDDDADMRLLMSALLEHLGAHVACAGDADELARALAAPCDLILLDLVMPAGAYEACIERLRASATDAAITLLSGSGSAVLADERQRLAATGLHMASSLTKPARLDDLAALLASIEPGARANARG